MYEYDNISKNEDPVPDVNSRPLKKGGVSVGAVVLIALFAVIITALVTYTLTFNFARDMYAIDENTPLGKIVAKLQPIEQTINDSYVRDINEDDLVSTAIRGYMYGIGDPYADYYTKEEFDQLMADLRGEGVGVGINVVWDAEKSLLQVINVIHSSPAEAAGVLPGDLIVEIKYEGETYSVAEIGYEDSLAKMLGEVGTIAEFSVLRGSEKIDFSITRAEFTNTTVMSHIYELDPSVGIIKISSFDNTTPPQFKEAIENLIDNGAKAFIIDVRNNPGGELNSVCTVLDYLLPEGPVIRTVDKHGNEEVVYTSDKNELDIPMAVLANENTASAGELFVSALMDYDKADFVGTNTFGKGSMQTTIMFNDGSGFKYTYRLYCPPFSDNYDGVGIAPDVTVDLDEDLKNINIYLVDDKDDNQLAAAYRQLIIED